MSRKVVFLDDGSVTAKRLKRALGGLPGYSCDGAENEAGLLRLLGQGPCVLLHVPSDPKRFAAVLARLLVERPQQPVLHIIEESLFHPEDWLKTPLNDWVSINTALDSVIRKIESLSHFGSLEREVLETRVNSEKLDRFQRTIRGVETGPVMRRAMEFLRGEMKASNVLFFPETQVHKELERFIESKNAVPLKPRTPPGRASWLPLKEFGPEKLTELFEKWNLMSAASLGETFDTQITEIGKSSTTPGDIVIPVQAFEQPPLLNVASIGSAKAPAAPYGHLVFLDPAGWPMLKGTRRMDSYVDLISQQLSETIAYGRLQAMTYKDDLTDLYNQRYLPLVLEQELNRASRTDKQFSVLFCDVDFFKLVNDTKGHMVGSRVLVELSKLFRGLIRATDFAFRYGGDEYVIILSGANSLNATLVAERLRRKTQDTTFKVSGSDVRVTVSIGIATYPEHARSAEEILQMADEAMYYGKNKSRNVVYVAS